MATPKRMPWTAGRDSNPLPAPVLNAAHPNVLPADRCGPVAIIRGRYKIRSGRAESNRPSGGAHGQNTEKPYGEPTPLSKKGDKWEEGIQGPDMKSCDSLTAQRHGSGFPGRLSKHRLEFLRVFIQPAGDEGCPEPVPQLLGYSGCLGIQLPGSRYYNGHIDTSVIFILVVGLLHYL